MKNLLIVFMLCLGFAGCIDLDQARRDCEAQGGQIIETTSTGSGHTITCIPTDYRGPTVLPVGRR